MIDLAKWTKIMILEVFAPKNQDQGLGLRAHFTTMQVTSREMIASPRETVLIICKDRISTQG